MIDTYCQFIESIGLSPFEFSALMVLFLAFKYFQTIDSALIFFNLLVFNLFILFSVDSVGAWFYVFVAIVDMLFLIAACIIKSHLVIITVLLVTNIYNAVSFTEFGTRYSFIYDHYEIFMQAAISILILSVFYTGVINGRTSTNNRLNHTSNNSRGFSLYFRGSQ